MKKLLLIYQKLCIGGKKRKQGSDRVLAQDNRRLQAQTDRALLVSCSKARGSQKASERTRASAGPPSS